MKVLITAYSVNPYKGSEDATGWNIPWALSKHHEVTVVTRKNNQPEIDRFLANHPNENLNFLYFDLPNWSMKLKKKMGERGYVLYFYFWQMFVPRFIRKSKLEFDLVHALNFHSDSQPQFLWTLGKPVFWGPIGHHPLVKKDFIRGTTPRKSWFKDRLYYAVKWFLRNMDPFYYISKWTAKKIFIINSSIHQVARLPYTKCHILPAVATDNFKLNLKEDNETFTFLTVGRLMYMKGFDCVIEGFAQFLRHQSQPDKFKLKVIGKGEDWSYLKALISKHQIEKYVELIAWVEKREMAEIYDQSNVFVFGSHEGAGMVVPEAMGRSLPVICFDNFGPGELVDITSAIKIPVTSYRNAVRDFSFAMHEISHNEKRYLNMQNAAYKHAQTYYNWDFKAKVISTAYLESKHSLRFQNESI